MHRPETWSTPPAPGASKTRSALSDLHNGAPAVVEPTPRVKRGAEWASASSRVDRFVLGEATDQAQRRERGDDASEGLYQLRSTWSVPLREDAHGAGADAGPGALSRREEALQRRLDDAERQVSKLQLAAALHELQSATGTLASSSLTSATSLPADSPAAERRRALRAEAERDDALAARDAAAARCCVLEEELSTALETCALLRRRAEDAEARARAFPVAPAPPPPPRAASDPTAIAAYVDLRDQVSSAVASLQALPKEARRQRLRLLRLQFHPDKQVAMHGLANTVTQLLNAELTALRLDE
jgi:hypothetical protein